MSAQKPRIGIIVAGPHINNLWLMLGVWWAGGSPVFVTAKKPRYEDRLDAIALTGGADVHPELYGGTPKTGYAYDLKRDEMEKQWVARADERDIPLLAICRGLQLLNVARGGDLHRDVRTIAERKHYPGAGIWPSLTFRKTALIEEGSKLHAIVGGRHLTINALHTQATNVVGDNLQVTARDENNVVQALEDPSRRFCVAVQFHPELLLYRTKHRAIFKGFVEAAKRVAVSSDLATA